MPIIPSLRGAERRGSLRLTGFQASQDTTPGLGKDSVSKVYVERMTEEDT